MTSCKICKIMLIVTEFPANIMNKKVLYAITANPVPVVVFVMNFSTKTDVVTMETVVK